MMQAFLCIFLVILLSAIDLWTKALAKAQFGLSSEETIPVIPNLNLVNLCNQGISFGLLGNLGPEILALIALSATLCIAAFFWRQSSRNNLTMVSVILITAGGIGNVVDRLRFGCVYDFVDFYVGDWHWYAFNLADSYVTIGGILILIEGLLPQPQLQPQPQKN